jgi:hypothetical protein
LSALLVRRREDKVKRTWYLWMARESSPEDYDSARRRVYRTRREALAAAAQWGVPHQVVRMPIPYAADYMIVENSADRATMRDLCPREWPPPRRVCEDVARLYPPGWRQEEWLARARHARADDAAFRRLEAT